MKINEKHFSVLMKCQQEISKFDNLLDRAWVGRSAKDWFRSVFPDKFCPHSLGDMPLNRRDVAMLVSDLGVEASYADTERVILEILAWGGMRAWNAKKASGCKELWIPICREMINGTLKDPVEAYRRFFELHNKNVDGIAGIGPSYYTKLIYFLCKNDGLIMDQWTSRSVNMLNLDGPFVKLNRGKGSAFSVARQNGPRVYENYLRVVQDVSREINFRNQSGKKISVAEAEALIFSISGDKRKRPKSLSIEEHEAASRWRTYILSC